ncbi:hypothetical protein C0991_002840 [Blastosporella zonata]|nr:hypothetical protein C0991_002840 [Blastosporella zonata]
MTQKKMVLVYNTTLLSSKDQQVLLQEFNHPQRPISIENPVSFVFADTGILGGEVESVVSLHKASPFSSGAEIEESFIIVADDGVSPSSRPQTVWLVKILCGTGEGKRAGHQAIRILASNVAAVFATIESGQHGWEDYWKVAEANGGHFPGE